MTRKETTVSSDLIYTGKTIQLRVDTVEMPNKGYQKREIIEHKGAVAIVAITDDNKIVLVKQYRKAVEKELYELPAGKIEIGENPLDCAIRELKEETGLDVIEILENTVKGQLFLSPGMTDESVTSAFCTCSGTISKGYMEEDEDIEPILLSQKEVQELLEKDVKFDIKCYIYLNQFAMLGKKMFE